MAFAITKSPTVKRPSRMPSAVSAITAPMPDGHDDRLPGVQHRERCLRLDRGAGEYLSIDLSKRRVSCASLLKYLTVS